MPSQVDTIKQQRSERLELIREQTGMTQSDFAKYLDMEAGSYSDIKRVRVGISQNVLKKLERKLNINIEWLLNGIGEMALEKTDSGAGSPLTDILIPYQKQTNDGVNAYIDRLFKLIERRDEQIEKLIQALKISEQENANKLTEIVNLLNQSKVKY